jgi:regulator of sirC expression with transglutaminase-like and TPR domain
MRLFQKANAVTTTTGILDYFTSLVAEDESLPLTEAALSLAQDAYPDLDMQGVLAEIDELVVRVRRRMPDDADIKQKVGVLNRFFFRELGFTSNLNDYHDPDNSHLNVVLKRRRGIPISLAVVYLEMGDQLGIPVRGVSFPAHFLLRVTTPDGDVMLDPTTGHSLSESAMVEMLEPYVQRVGESIGSALRMLLQPATRREIIARMLGNLKGIYLQTERWQRLLAVQQRRVILMPENIEEVRDRGFAYARLDYLRPAMEDLRRYLDERPEAEDATVVESELHELRQRMQHNGD